MTGLSRGSVTPESPNYHIDDTSATLFLDDDQLHVETQTFLHKNNPYRLFNQVHHTADPDNHLDYQIIIGGNKHFRFKEDKQGRVLDVERVPKNKRPGGNSRIRTYVATVLGKQFLLHKHHGIIVGASAPRLTNQIPVPQVPQLHPPPPSVFQVVQRKRSNIGQSQGPE